MNLTPLDVRRKQFDKGFRGYDPTEVDLFLKQAADALEVANEGARRAEERVREVENKLVHYEKVELALQEALESARETARRSEASAEERARLIVQEAELRAQQIVQDAERERHGLRQDVVRLNSRQTEVAARLRGFLLSELEVLAQFQGDDPVGFIKLQPSEQVPLPAPPQQLDAAREVPLELSPEPPRSEPPAALDEAISDVVEPTWPSTPTPQDLEAQASDDTEPPSGVYASADESPSYTDEPPEESPQPPAVTGGWDLRSLVTGEERSVSASDEERERIRRILDDLD